MFSRMPEYLEATKDNIIVHDAFTKADTVLNRSKYKSISCSISGGSDSDIMLDLVRKVDTAIYHPRVRYIYFDTGLEYQATKDHIKYLAEKYGINIYTFKPSVPIPKAVRENGQPFLSKYVSSQIEKLQRAGFNFEDDDYETLKARYSDAGSALTWWGNKYKGIKYNISRIRYLKDFLILNPPKFPISNKCCDYAKKSVAHEHEIAFNVDLAITGIRKSEGGVRSMVYQSCFDSIDDEADKYRPIFWFTKSDKEYYEDKFGITHSRCYSEYGFMRTGCACCPYGTSDLHMELEQTKYYEPNLYKAVVNIFKESLEYTKEWQQYQFDRRIQTNDGKL